MMGYTWYAEQEQRNSIAQTIALCSRYRKVKVVDSSELLKK